jgi:hypothetical protein
MGDAENPGQTSPYADPNPPPNPPIIPSNNQAVLGQAEAQERKEEIQETKQLIKQTTTVEWLQLGVNAVLAVIGIIAIFVYIGQLRSMNRNLAEVQKQTPEIQKQAVAAQKQIDLLRDADRPWIDISVTVSSVLTYDNSGVHVGFSFMPKNIGKSPAQNIWIGASLKPLLMADDATEIQKGICGGANYVNNPIPRYLLFPDKEYIQPYGLQMSAADANSHLSKFELSQGPIDPIPITLVGCVDYTYQTSPLHHQTGFAFDVLMKDGRLVLKSKTPLAPDSLALSPHSAGGHFAN